MKRFTSSFSIWMLLCIFHSWWHWLELSVQYWIEVVRTSISDSFYFLEKKKIQTFSFSLLSMMLAVCFSRMPSSQLRKLLFHTKLAECFYQKWSCIFAKCFSCIHWEDQMGFLSQFVSMVHYIHLFSNVIPSLHSWDKPHLILMYYLFNIFLDWFF